MCAHLWSRSNLRCNPWLSMFVSSGLSSSPMYGKKNNNPSPIPTNYPCFWRLSGHNLLLKQSKVWACSCTFHGKIMDCVSSRSPLISMELSNNGVSHQWEFQDPKMEVLYHIKPYFGGIFPYIGLKHRPYIW